MRRTKLPAALLAASVLAALAPAPAALADADPPSDVIIGFDYYVPFKRPDDAHEKQLRALMKIANARGERMRTVIIADRSDLGAVPRFLGRPQPYADFLDKEVRTFFKVRGQDPTLIIVMQDGFALEGGRDATQAANAALRQIKVPRGASGNELTTAAVEGVHAVAKANGRPLPDVALARTTATTNKGSSTAAVVIIATLAVVTVGALVALLRLRRRPAHES
jgi:hypothetical protein